MSNLTPHEQFVLELQRSHNEQLNAANDRTRQAHVRRASELTEANDRTRRAHELLTSELRENTLLIANNNFLKELTVEQKDQITKLKLTVKGAAVFGILGGAIVATILTTYVIWATSAL